ncbi:hypothetical protein D2E51_17850 [Mycobacteroides abscessus]|uniref:Uncharacterized protein n=1 Tax=Mycobacteroides abscessus TaxID=36809 RepID=A0AB33TEJ9_9MYCO|nr:hypothetical protein D2E51_17850 [Mycobacteroides abscessus]SHV70150.1 Uncharacterised protein [Mycobacteroides abscessus subsp. abscessus]SKI84524.1 Uncharacterised protein [Mycobacteroides abscessus subsp. massiliense]CPT66941.1 Uncharacterised protein [Mycobacteroides abscessus]CPT77041.1 Uncharacterised protein [Mycobacteroides abscessus]
MAERLPWQQVRPGLYDAIGGGKQIGAYRRQYELARYKSADGGYRWQALVHEPGAIGWSEIADEKTLNEAKRAAQALEDQPLTS